MSTVNKSSFIDRKGWIFRVRRLWRNFKTTPYLRGLHQRLSSAVSSHQRWLHSDPEVSSFNDKSRNPHLTFALVTESTQIWSHSSQRRYKTTKTTSEEKKKPWWLCTSRLQGLDSCFDSLPFSLVWEQRTVPWNKLDKRPHTFLFHTHASQEGGQQQETGGQVWGPETDL